MGLALRDDRAGAERAPSAALPHRRIGRRRQEHADRPAAARRPRHPRRPARRARGARRRRPADRPRAAHRRPRGRARAGHHDRRRLPLLRDPRAQVHHRRRARPRAVHAQHGDGGRGQRRRGRPRRRDQARARRRGAVSCCRRRAATPFSPNCCACRTSSSRSTSSTRSPMRARAFARVRAALVDFAAEAGFVPAGIVPISALHGDNVSRPSALGGYDGPTLLALLEQLPDDDVATDGAALLPVQYVGADSRQRRRPPAARAVGPGRARRGRGRRRADGVPERRDARTSPSCTSPARASTASAPAARPASSSIASSTSRAATGSPRPTASRRRHAFAPRSPGSTPSPR